jgi:Spy/CpxP family protein refolding chaperone
MMNPQQMMLGSLMLLATVFAAQPLKAFAAQDVNPEGSCMARMSHDHKGHGSHGKGPEAMPHYLHGLNLSEGQKDQIFQLMHGKAPQFRELGKKARQAHEDLANLTFSENYDAAKAKSLTNSAARNHSEMLVLRASVDQEIYKLLNAEQRKKVAADIAGKGLPPVM